MNDKELFARYAEKMASFDDDRFSHMSKDLLKGHNSYLRMKFKGSSIFNPSWIKKIEDCLYELGQIINNPREVTTEEGNVTPIELAKKVNGESVQHLAMHSQYVKDITEEGDVVPAKILSHYNKEEIHTYENRFIATFIRRLILFVEKRYEFIKKTVNLDEKDILYVKNKSIVDGQEVEIETKISVKRAIEDDLAKTARDYIARIDKLKEYVTYYYNSPFMKEFKTEKNVRKPILQTNIIRKNPLYNKCYETFLFIENFDSLGVAFKSDKLYQAFNEKERKALNYILVSNLLSLEATQGDRAYKKAEKTYKPKLLTSIDDEVFLYGDFVKGPIDFVRSDETYLNYLKSITPKDLPAHPNSSEKAYYKDEYDKKKSLSDQIKEIEALLNRIRRQIAKYERLLEKYLAERDEEEAVEARKELERLRAEEQSILDKKREAIIKAAQEQAKEADKKPKKAKAEKKVEEPKTEPVKEEPAPEVVPEPAPVVEEQPVQEETPTVEESPVEEQPQEEIALVEEAIAEDVLEETPIEVQEEEQIPEPVLEEPVIEDKEPEPVVEEPVSEPIEEVAPVEETPVEVTPEPVPEVEEPKVEEKPAKVEKKAKTAKKSTKKAPAKKAAKSAKKVEKKAEEKAEPKKEEASAPAPVKKAEPKKEKKAKPVKQEKKPAPKAKEEKKVAPKPKKEKKSTPAPVKKSEPKKEKPAPKAKPVPVKEERKAIPGKFIVKTLDGYYVNQKRLSQEKSEAKIFDDFNLASDIKKKLGGKIVKL